jgi:hypothetical protein
MPVNPPPVNHWELAESLIVQESLNKALNAFMDQSSDTHPSTDSPIILSQVISQEIIPPEVEVEDFASVQNSLQDSLQTSLQTSLSSVTDSGSSHVLVSTASVLTLSKQSSSSPDSFASSSHHSSAFPPVNPEVSPAGEVQIEVSSEVLGYEKHLLEQLLHWLDRAMTWLEKQLEKLWGIRH